MSNHPRVAALCTEVRPNSHADVIVGRWLAPYPQDASVGWQNPASRIVSIYAQQRHPQRDLLPAWQERHGITVVESIREALTLGGETLAVDAVLLIAEHGDYPENEFGQKLYPRKEFFDEMVRVFQESGRVVPVFFDKHLSWNPDWIREMWDTIESMGIPFLGGSSIPFSTQLPPEAPLKSPGDTAAIFFGGWESYLFHAAELVECLGWGLPPGHIGVERAEGAQTWVALEQDPDGWSLLLAAAEAAGMVQVLEALRSERNADTALFRFTAEDGSRLRFFREPNRIRKWAAATRTKEAKSPVSTVADTRGHPGFHPHFARLCVAIDRFFQTGEVPFPPSRILTTSLLTAQAMQARPSNPGSFRLI